ncbi:MAG TPA: tyrosine-type recombinase/integrase [Polyangiaceae bacterium]|nr:tyrosine-type recombinase/integrase [Polyangiaceae bacterium]
MRLPCDLHAGLAEIRADLSRALGRLDRLALPAANGGETLDAWIKRWLKHRRVSDIDQERRMYEIWIQPQLGTRPVASIARVDVESWVERMDRAVVERRIRDGTAARLWSRLRVMMRDACSSKVQALRVRPDNPTLGVLGPDRSARRAATFLYPSEFLRLMRCRRIPLWARRLYAITVYLYPRAGEVTALTWEDLDRSGHVHIHKSRNRKGHDARTKTEADRQFIAERAVLPLLRAMRRDRNKGSLFPHIPQRQNLARMLRQHLRWAGCKRADLYASDDARRPLTYHDLRATGITWQAMRGDAPTDIMERVGHTQITTTQGYMRRGRLMARARGERPFPALPKCLLRKAT